MLWLIPALAAVLIWTGLNVLDKFVVSEELKDPMLATVIIGACIFPIFLIVSLVSGSVMIPLSAIILSLCAGMIYGLASLMYYYVLEKEDVSKAMPLMCTAPMFIILIAFIFLGERLSVISYYGISLILIGSIVISLKDLKHWFRFDAVLLLALVAAFFYAIRSVFMKVAATGGSAMPVLFWMGLGVGFTTLVFYIIHHPHIHKKARLGIKHLVVSGVMTGIALVVYMIALAMGPISLVASIEATQPLFVFAAATLISRFHPEILHEKLTTDALLQKMLSVLLIISGTVLII